MTASARITISLRIYRRIDYLGRYVWIIGYLIESIMIDHDRINQLIDQIPILIDFLITRQCDQNYRYNLSICGKNQTVLCYNFLMRLWQNSAKINILSICGSALTLLGYNFLIRNSDSWIGKSICQNYSIFNVSIYALFM